MTSSKSSSMHLWRWDSSEDCVPELRSPYALIQAVGALESRCWVIVDGTIYLTCPPGKALTVLSSGESSR